MVLPDGDFKTNISDTKKTFEDRIANLKIALEQELGWGNPHSEAVVRINKMIEISQRTLDNLPQVVDD